MYCSMNGVEVKLPERTLRPREPGAPQPSVTMRSPMVAKRMQRPRTKWETAIVGVDVKECLHAIRRLKQKQHACEKELKRRVEKLKLDTAQFSPVDLKYAQSCIDKLLREIESLAAQANEAAMAAIKGGATQAQVRAAAGEGPVSSRTLPGRSISEPAAPAPGSSDAVVSAPVVVETNSPAILPDGSIIPGPDAQLTTPDGKPVTPPSGEGEEEEKSSNALWLLAGAGAALWLWSRSKKRG